MSYGPPDSDQDLSQEICYFPIGNGDDACLKQAVTTRYDAYTRDWLPVCDDHRRDSDRPHTPQCATVNNALAEECDCS